MSHCIGPLSENEFNLSNYFDNLVTHLTEQFSKPFFSILFQAQTFETMTLNVNYSELQLCSVVPSGALDTLFIRETNWDLVLKCAVCSGY